VTGKQTQVPWVLQPHPTLLGIGCNVRPRSLSLVTTSGPPALGLAATPTPGSWVLDFFVIFYIIKKVGMWHIANI